MTTKTNKCAGTFAELRENLGLSWTELAHAMRDSGKPSPSVSRRDEDPSDARRARALRQANAERMTAFVRAKV